MNFMKESLVEGIRDKVGALREIGALEEIRALLLSASYLLAGPWGLASSSCFLVRLAKGLL